MGRLPITLREGYDVKLDKIVKLDPTLGNRTNATETAIDKLYEWLVQFSREERAVFESHARGVKKHGKERTTR